MTASTLIPGSQYFADPRSGRPASNALIYIGAPNTDPTVLANRVTVTLTKQDGSTVSIPPASQPLNTTGGGLLSYNGSAVQAQVASGAYSIALHDSSDNPLDYFPSVNQPVSIDTPILQADNFYTNDASSASNAYVIVPPVTTTALLDGQEITFRPSANGSGPCTINVVGASGLLGAHQWVLPDGTSDLPNDYVKTTRDYKVRWNAGLSVFIEQDLGLFSYNPSIQAWNTHIDYYKVPSYVTGSDGNPYKSKSQTGPNLGGSFDPVSDAGVHWTRIYENVTPPTSYNGNAGHIYGLTLSNDVGTPATIIDIAAGSARDSTNAIDMTITTAWTKKINAVWAAGTGNGGFPSGLTGGVPVNNTTYSFWEISKTDGTVDFGFDSAANGIANTPTLLQTDAATYTLFRRIGWVRYGVATIVAFYQDGNTFLYSVSVNDFNANVPGATTETKTFSAPPLTTAIMAAVCYNASGVNVDIAFRIRQTAMANAAASATDFDMFAKFGGAGETENVSGVLYKLLDSSSQAKVSTNFASNKCTYSININGWIDYRGQY